MNNDSLAIQPIGVARTPIKANTTTEILQADDSERNIIVQGNRSDQSIFCVGKFTDSFNFKCLRINLVGLIISGYVEDALTRTFQQSEAHPWAP